MKKVRAALLAVTTAATLFTVGVTPAQAAPRATINCKAEAPSKRADNTVDLLLTTNQKNATGKPYAFWMHIWVPVGGGQGYFDVKKYVGVPRSYHTRDKVIWPNKIMRVDAWHSGTKCTPWIKK